MVSSIPNSSTMKRNLIFVKTNYLQSFPFLTSTLLPCREVNLHWMHCSKRYKQETRKTFRHSRKGATWNLHFSKIVKSGSSLTSEIFWQSDAILVDWWLRQRNNNKPKSMLSMIYESICLSDKWITENNDSIALLICFWSSAPILVVLVSCTNWRNSLHYGYEIIGSSRAD